MTDFQILIGSKSKNIVEQDEPIFEVSIENGEMNIQINEDITEECSPEEL